MTIFSQLAQASIKIKTGNNGTNQANIPTARVDNLDSILSVVYTWAGIVAVIVIVIAGFLYITSVGDPGKTKTAKNALLYAIIGLVVIVMAYVITQFVIGQTTGITGVSD